MINTMRVTMFDRTYELIKHPSNLVIIAVVAALANFSVQVTFGVILKNNIVGVDVCRENDVLMMADPFVPVNLLKPILLPWGLDDAFVVPTVTCFIDRTLCTVAKTST